GAAFSHYPLTDPTPSNLSSIHFRPPPAPRPVLHPAPTPKLTTQIPKPNKPFDESSFGALSLDDHASSLTTNVSLFFSDVLSGFMALHDPDVTPLPRPAEGAGDVEL
ncbi:hypothetical protein C0995_011656, partial [Termitomyces sp. Mi166